MIKPQLEELTNNNIINITFIKKDGSLRNMRCTTAWNFLKKNDKVFSKTPDYNKGNRSMKSLKYVLVWDLDSSGFRLIDPNKVIKYEIDRPIKSNE